MEEDRRTSLLLFASRDPVTTAAAGETTVREKRMSVQVLALVNRRGIHCSESVQQQEQEQEEQEERGIAVREEHAREPFSRNPFKRDGNSPRLPSLTPLPFPSFPASVHALPLFPGFTVLLSIRGSRLQQMMQTRRTHASRERERVTRWTGVSLAPPKRHATKQADWPATAFPLDPLASCHRQPL